MTDGPQLLADYAKTGSEEAFRELVSRYIDLVYSTATRSVNGDSHLAEDVAQTVFADLARLARSLPRGVLLGGWLHRHTCFIASKTMRGERRRLARERQAVEMNIIQDHSAENLDQVAPILDDAINQLGSEDRAAVVLRYYEQQSFEAVGESLGTNEEAARKRVDRALDKLALMLKRRGVTLSAAALGSALATQAVTAAPAGLVVTISAAAIAGTAGSSATTLTILKIMSMTKLKVGIVTAVVVAGISVPLVMQQRTKSELNDTKESLRQMTERNAQLQTENERLAGLNARAASSSTTANTSPSAETLKLRGEVGRLRRENTEIASSRTNGPSALSGMTSNPEMYKLIRDQQKAAMKMVYNDFTNRIQLAPERAEKLVDILADDVMENIQRVTEVLRDGKTGEALNQVFTAQEAALEQSVQTVLSPEEFTQYKEYTQNVASLLTAEQFKPMMSGDKAAKEAKAKQMYQLMLEETQNALSSAGLPSNYQTVPTMNFRNFTSDSEAEKNLKLLDDIYGRLNTRLGTVLSAGEQEKFAEFRSGAITRNRMALALNRKMMAPGGK